MLCDLPLTDFIRRVASKDPVPGGGSVSALAGALAAALSAMVAGLTIGRPAFAEAEGDMLRVRDEAGRLESRLRRAVDADADAYGRVMDAFSLPRATEEEKQARSLAVQKAFVGAAQVPLGVAADAVAVLELAIEAVVKGNPNALSDAAVAGMMARTAAMGALMNVRINLAAIADTDFVRSTRSRADELAARVRELESRLLQEVEARLD